MNPRVPEHYRRNTHPLALAAACNHLQLERRIDSVWAALHCTLHSPVQTTAPSAALPLGISAQVLFNTPRADIRTGARQRCSRRESGPPALQQNAVSTIRSTACTHLRPA